MNTPLVTEREFYNQCSLFTNENRDHVPEENEKRTYFLLCIYETDENVGSWGAIVDPGIPSKVRKEAFAEMTWGQQALISSGPKLQKLIKREIPQISTVHTTAKQLNISPGELLDTIAKSDSPEEAKEKLQALVGEKL